MKRLFSAILVLALLLCAIPFSVSAAESELSQYVYVGKVKLTDGQYLANNSTTPVTNAPAGGFAYFKDGELTLNNYSYKGSGYMHTGFFFTDDDGINHHSLLSSAIFFPKKGLLKVLGTNTIRNNTPNPTDTSTDVYTHAPYGIVTLSDLEIYGSGALNIEGQHGIADSNLPDEDPKCRYISISCAEFNCITDMGGISMGNYLEKNTLNINCESFKLFTGMYGISVENQYSSAEINFNGGNATIYAAYGLTASDYYSETTNDCIVNVKNTNLRVNSSVIGATCGVINVHSGDAYINGLSQAVTGVAFAGDRMVYEEASVGGEVLSIVPADKYSTACDVNSDGSIDVFDYMAVKNICIFGSDDKAVVQKADITGDGSVDIFDYLNVKSRYFNPPVPTSTFEEASFDAFCQYISDHGSYSSSDKCYAIKITDITSGKPQKNFALKTDKNFSKIIITAASAADSAGVATSAELTLTRGDFVGKISATYNGSSALTATGTVDISGFCATVTKFDSFKCTGAGATVADFESRAAALLGEAVSLYESRLGCNSYVSFIYLGFYHI